MPCFAVSRSSIITQFVRVPSMGPHIRIPFLGGTQNSKTKTKTGRCVKEARCPVTANIERDSTVLTKLTRKTASRHSAQWNNPSRGGLSFDAR